MAEQDQDVHVKLLTRHQHYGIVLSPDILQAYKKIDEPLPLLIVQAIDGQLQREYKYALIGQIVAGTALVLMAGGFIFLVMNGHDKPAYALLGAGVLNIVGGFLRARLAGGDGKESSRDAR